MDPELELPASVELTGRAGALKLRFTPPQSLAIRTMLGYSVATHDQERVWCAAMWHCSSTIRQHVRDPGKLPALGLAVMDWLLGEGVSYVEILGAAQVAWLHCVRALPDWEAAKRTEDFTGATPDESTS